MRARTHTHTLVCHCIYKIPFYVGKIYHYVTDVDEAIQLQEQEYVAIHFIRMLCESTNFFAVATILKNSTISHFLSSFAVGSLTRSTI